MRAYELTVNDYVLGRDDILIKISAVHLKKIGWQKTQGKLDWIRLDQVKPVPLNPDILERIGFKEDETGEYDRVIDGVHYTIRRLGNSDTYLWLDIIVIRYLHELQHILTYCGFPPIKNLERN